MLEEGAVNLVAKIATAPFRFLWAVGRSAWYGLLGYPVVAPKFVQEQRHLSCKNCEHNTSGLCSLCICVIDAKVLLSAEECPDKPPRWRSLPPELPESEE